VTRDRNETLAALSARRFGLASSHCVLAREDPISKANEAKMPLSPRQASRLGDRATSSVSRVRGVRLEQPMAFEREVASPTASESGLGAIRDLEHEFARALAQAELYGAILDDRLRHVLHRVVDTAKAGGKNPDDIIGLVKDIARRGGFARPDAVRPVSSFPADRLLTKAITACIERYHEADAEVAPVSVADVAVVHIDPHDLVVIASGGDDRGAVASRLRALLSHGNEQPFARAVASYVRSAPSRGLNLDAVLAGVHRIIDAIDDAGTESSVDEPSRAHDLVMRGMLMALYEGGSAERASVVAANQPGVRSYLKPAAQPITPSR